MGEQDQDASGVLTWHDRTAAIVHVGAIRPHAPCQERLQTLKTWYYFP